jgi:hypothetical protein
MFIKCLHCVNTINDVKYILKYHKLPYDHSAVLDGYSHPIVDKLKHLAAFGRLKWVSVHSNIRVYHYHDCKSSNQTRCLEDEP